MSFQLFSLARFAALLLTSIFLARSLPDQELISRYEFLLLLGGSVTFFWVSGLFDAFVVLHAKSPAPVQGHTISLSFRIALILGLGSGATVWLLGAGLFPDRILLRELTSYALFIGLDTIALTLIYFLLVRKKHIQLLVMAAVSALGYLLAFLPVPGSGNLELTWWLLAGLALLKLILLFFLVPMQWGKSDGPPLFPQLWKLAWPLATVALVSHSATYVDGFLVEEYFPDQFTNFRYGARELPLVILLANSMSVVRSGEIARGLKENQLAQVLNELRGSGQRLLLWLLPLSLGLLLISDWLFRTVFGPGFSGAVPIFDAYLLLFIPRLVFPQTVLRGHEKMTVMTWSASAELVVNLSLSLMGLYFFGLIGIALATVVAFSVEKAILVVYCQRKLGIGFREYTAIGTWLATSALLLGTWIWKYLG